jgi:hypothetical protein
MAYARTSSNLPDRMLRAARLDVQLYEDVEADVTATMQALTVVVLVAIATGVGSAVGASFDGARVGNPVGILISGIINALVGWAVWSYVVYFVGTRFFGGTSTYGELLRTLGFAETPGLLAILGFVPVLGGPLVAIAGIWTLVASFIAIRQALDISNGKTVATVIVGVIGLVIAVTIIATIVAAVFGVGYAVGRGFV